MNQQEDIARNSSSEGASTQSFLQHLRKRVVFKVLLGGIVFLISFFSALVFLNQLMQNNEPAQAQKTGREPPSISPSVTAQSYGKEVIGFLPSWMVAKNAYVDSS